MGKGNEGNRETAVGNVGLLMNFKHIDKRMRFRKRKNRSNIRKRYYGEAQRGEEAGRLQM